MIIPEIMKEYDTIWFINPMNVLRRYINEEIFRELNKNYFSPEPYYFFVAEPADI